MKPIVRLSFFFSIFIILFLLFGLIINNQFNKFGDLVENLHDHPMAVMRSSASASTDVVKISRNMKEILLLKNKKERDKEIGSLIIYANNITRELKLVRARITGEEGLELVGLALDTIKKWYPVRDKIIKLADEGRLEEAIKILRDEGDNRLSDAESAITKITNYAVGQGMSYHAEGIQVLRKAKIILFVAGFIVVLLFVVVGFVIGRFLIRPEVAVRGFLTETVKDGLNLHVPFDPKDGGSMGVPLLELIKLMENKIVPAQEKLHDLQTLIATIDSERKTTIDKTENLGLKSNNLNKQSTRLIENITPLIDTIETFNNAAKQIENDLVMMQQITSSQQLILGSIRNAVEPEKLHVVCEQEKAINEYVKSSLGVISQATTISTNLIRSLKEITAISSEQIVFSGTINEMLAGMETVTKRLDTLSDSLASLTAVLKCQEKVEHDEPEHNDEQTA